MVLRDATVVYERDMGRFAWSGLKRFHHVSSLTDTLIRIHSIPPKHRANASNQALQIRQCLSQAREYREASQAVTLITKPVLLYYSLMSSALAQILFHGTGADSLDAARGEHAHHGLSFGVSATKRDQFSLRDAASSLGARPMVEGLRRRGTFELWHRIAREDPIIGKATMRRTTEAIEAPGQVFYAANDVRMGVLNAGGMSFLDCLLGLPGMVRWVERFGLKSRVVRAHIQQHTEGNQTTHVLTVHPHEPKRVEQLMNEIIVRPSDYEKIDVADFEYGFRMHVVHVDNNHASISMPACTSWDTEEIRFLPSKSVINEFGYLYIGLYIMGNYARYYPDLWTADVEASSPLALAAEEFISIAEWRMAQLTLSELSETYFIAAR